MNSPKDWLKTALLAGLMTTGLVTVLMWVPLGPWLVPLGAGGAVFLIVLYFNPAYFLRRVGVMCLISAITFAGMGLSAAVTINQNTVLDILVKGPDAHLLQIVIAVIGVVCLCLDTMLRYLQARHQQSEQEAIHFVVIRDSCLMVAGQDYWQARVKLNVKNQAETALRPVNIVSGIQSDRYTHAILNKTTGTFSETSVRASSSTEMIITAQFKKRWWHRNRVHRTIRIEDSVRRSHGPFWLIFVTEPPASP